MNIVKSSVIALSCAGLLSANAFAHTDHNMTCNSNINAELSFSNKELLVKSTTDQDILFTAKGEVTVDGKALQLSASEQQLAKRYYNGIEDSIPMVVDITVEALNITNLALTEVFVGLLGEDSKVAAHIDNKLSDLSKAIEDHVYQNPDSLTFNSAYFEEDLGISSDLDAEIEEMTAELVSTAMGEVLMAVGRAMITGDDGFSQLETRMNKVGDQIEEKSTYIAAKLEDKAEILCDQLISLDETETKLSELKALKYLNMIVLNKSEA